MLIFILTTVLAIVAAALYWLKTTKPVDFETFMSRTIFAVRLPHFFHAIGLSRHMRPQQNYIMVPGGKRIPIPVPMSEDVTNAILKMDVRDDDIFVVTFPKSGTSWIQEIIWLLLNDCDVKKAGESPSSYRIPFLELVGAGYFKGFQDARDWPKNSRRIIRSHLQLEALPEKISSGSKCKVVYLVRNPKDVCASYFCFHQMNVTMPEPGNWSEFLTRFCAGELGGGSWFDHVFPFWKMAESADERVYFTSYEDLQKDLKGEIRKLAKFLEKDPKEEHVDAIVKHSTFAAMGENEATNYKHASEFMMDFTKSKFLRKGQVGDWKNYFTLNQNVAFDAMFDEKMKDTNLKVRFEI